MRVEPRRPNRHRQTAGKREVCAALAVGLVVLVAVLVLIGMDLIDAVIWVLGAVVVVCGVALIVMACMALYSRLIRRGRGDGP